MSLCSWDLWSPQPAYCLNLKTWWTRVWQTYGPPWRFYLEDHQTYVETIETGHVHFTLIPKLDNLCSQEPIKLACLYFCFYYSGSFVFRTEKHHVDLIIQYLYTISCFWILFPHSSLSHAVWAFVVIWIHFMFIPPRLTLYTSKFGGVLVSYVLQVPLFAYNI